MKKGMKQVTVIVATVALMAGFLFPASIAAASETTTIDLVGYTWAKTTVTYNIEAGRGVTQAAVEQAMLAVEKWNEKTNAYGFSLQEVSETPSVISQGKDGKGNGKGGEKADIIIKLKVGGGVVQGLTVFKTSRDGFFKSVNINVSGKAFGLNNPDTTILSIAMHELGHGLGLGHANNHDDLMHGMLQTPPITEISAADMAAWEAVMDWLIKGEEPHPPTVGSITYP